MLTKLTSNVVLVNVCVISRTIDSCYSFSNAFSSLTGILSILSVKRTRFVGKLYFPFVVKQRS